MVFPCYEMVRVLMVFFNPLDMAALSCSALKQSHDGRYSRQVTDTVPAHELTAHIYTAAIRVQLLHSVGFGAGQPTEGEDGNGQKSEENAP